jgi:hypothetical protein
MLESTLTLCQGRIYSPVSDFGFGIRDLKISIYTEQNEGRRILKGSLLKLCVTAKFGEGFLSRKLVKSPTITKTAELFFQDCRKCLYRKSCLGILVSYGQYLSWMNKIIVSLLWPPLFQAAVQTLIFLRLLKIFIKKLKRGLQNYICIVGVSDTKSIHYCRLFNENYHKNANCAKCVPPDSIDFGCVFTPQRFP